MGGGVDWDAFWTAAGTIMYGPGSKVLMVIIVTYLVGYGLGHGHMWTAALGFLVAVMWFGMGVFLGKLGIAFNDVPQAVMVATREAGPFAKAVYHAAWASGGLA